ncbi:hypothetical protein H8E07_04555 [bacterium]|nr:hypothetical protein [bacterium]
MPYRVRILIVFAGSLLLGCYKERPVARDVLILMVDEAATDDSGDGAAGAPPADDAWLRPARPNPFLECVDLPVELAHSSRLRIAVYDAAGRRLAVLVDDHRTEGRHRITWCGRDAAGRRAPAGIYFARLSAADRRESRRLVLLR